MRSEYDQVCTLLKKNINLLTTRTIGIDCSGRIFRSVSPFEYALWAMDSRMYKLMLARIPKGNQKVLNKLRSQYDALIDKDSILALTSERGHTPKLRQLRSEEKEETVRMQGVSYWLNGKQITERHFDFENTLIKELQCQVNAIDALGYKDWAAIHKQWIEGVGGAQRLLPMHFVYEYCAYCPCDRELPEFTTYPKASKRFYNGETKQVEDWFMEGSRLGIDVAIYGNGNPDDPEAKPNGWRWCTAGIAWLTVGAMKVLYQVRTNDFINLAVQFEEKATADKQLGCVLS